MSTAIRVLLADDHAVIREGIRALLEHAEGIEVIGEADNGEEAVRMALRLRPDVVLLDLIMPVLSGIEVLKEIKQETRDVRILVLTSFADDDKVFAAVKAGAMGYLLKQTAPDELIQAVRDVYLGESSLHPTIARKLIRELKQPATLPAGATPLTDREVEVVIYIARGLSNQDIGNRLVISERTVRTHVSNILSKLHLANRTLAALYALKEALTSLEEVEV